MGRYDLTDFEWNVIEPLMPMDRRGPKPKNNRQITNGMSYILRTSSPWRDLPERYGPYRSVYNRHSDQGAIPNIPNKSNRKKKYRWKKILYRERNCVERFFNKLKNFRRIGTRYDKTALSFISFLHLAGITLWLK